MGSVYYCLEMRRKSWNVAHRSLGTGHQGSLKVTLGKLAPKWAKDNPNKLWNLRNINRRSYLGGLGSE